MKFKTEMHCHTQESSLRCGKIPTKDVVEAYINADYSTLVLTNHFGAKHETDKGNNHDIEIFLKSYEIAKDAAKGRINIILGMEINLSENKNDYLIYGITEDFIYKNPHMYKLRIEDFSAFIHENGLLIYQAHPFRNHMTVVYPAFLDGIEVYNAHPRHDSRNSISKAWAELYDIKTISGSDTHQPPDLARGGILTETEITNSDELLDVLKNNNYELIISD